MHGLASREAIYIRDGEIRQPSGLMAGSARDVGREEDVWQVEEPRVAWRRLWIGNIENRRKAA